MDIDYEKEGQQFLDELKAKKFNIEVIPNKGLSNREQEESELAAYSEYLKSDDFKSFYNEVFKDEALK